MNEPTPILLRRGDATATVSPLGAEWRAWRVDGADLLWTPDPAYWDATSPVLFPVCGWTRDGVARVDGVDYPLGLHGFARAELFEVETSGADFVRLLLRDNPRTRAQYPHAFELRVEYRLAASTLDVVATIRNAGARVMPYAFGLHPGFRWPFAGGDKSDYRVVFDQPERPEVPVIAPGGLFSPRRRPVAFADARTLPLDDATFEAEALCFLDAASAGLSFVGPGGRALRVEMENFPHVVLWSRPGAPYLCIESWTGHGDPEGFAGELADKPSMIALAPGAEGRHAMRYRLEGD